MTKLKVKEIVLTHLIEGEEPWPDEQVDRVIELDNVEDVDLDEDDQGADSEGSKESKTTDTPNDGSTIEWDFTKNNEDDQMTLF